MDKGGKKKGIEGRIEWKRVRDWSLLE